MRAVIQRVSQASVAVDGAAIASIERGLVILLGVAEGDTAEQAARLARKIAELRIFADGEGRFNRSLLETNGQALVVSQFTLLGDVRKGRRPSFASAASPEDAAPLVDAFIEELGALGIQTGAGRFGARMVVELANDGPVTLLLDTDDLERPRHGA